jgi:LuxR family maltose regulon positive regulatory protein
MPTSILATKLYAPPARPEGVTRPRLLARLSLGPARKLTLVSAPAGFGKSTLVTQWIAALRAADDQGQQGTDAVGHAAVHVAWLALDEGDNDFTRFLAYVIAALQRTAPHVGDGVLRVLDASQPPPNDALLTALLNDLAALDGSTVLVLDDYHMLENREIDQAIAFLLEHAPPHFRLVMTSREDPPLPLARYRARGQLTEVRAADLRFTPEEAAVFLNQAMGLSLSAPAIAALERRTEGWIAGLQLAALSMQGRADADAFVQAFAGDNRYILDYLVEEVLQDQPDAVRRFLLHTSILTRLTGPLCDAVTVTEGDSVTGGSAQLDALERANLFVISLDDRRQWYRYHHLFADVLRAHLRAEEPDLLPTLHARASRWYEQNGFPGDAIRHALAAEDFSRAAVLLERVWPAMDRSRQAATWRGWLTALPDEQVRTRPVLCVAHAWALLDAGALEAAAEYLDRAEQLVDVDRPPEPAAMAAVVDDVEQFRALPASIATARAYLALAHDDLRDARAHAQQALARLPAEDHLQRGVAAALLGLAAWADGDLAAADQAMSTAAASFQTAGNVLFAITGAYVQAEMRAAQGRLHAASEVCHRALALAEGQGEPVVWGTADLYTGLGELSRERNRLDEAAALAPSLAHGPGTPGGFTGRRGSRIGTPGRRGPPLRPRPGARRAPGGGADGPLPRGPGSGDRSPGLGPVRGPCMG